MKPPITVNFTIQYVVWFGFPLSDPCDDPKSQNESWGPLRWSQRRLVPVMGLENHGRTRFGLVFPKKWACMLCSSARWCPPAYKLIIIPLTIDISTLNHDLKTNLANYGAPPCVEIRNQWVYSVSAFPIWDTARGKKSDVLAITFICKKILDEIDG